MATARKTSSTTAEAFETTAAINADALKEGFERMSKGFSDLAELQKNSVEAMMASSNLFAKGIEKAAAEQSAFLKAAYEDGVAAAKAASSSKSVQDAFEVQSEYLRSAFEKNLGYFNKLADHWMATGKQAAEPLQARYNEFVEKVQAFRP